MWENADQNNSECGHFSRSVRQDPDKLIFNYSNTSLSKVVTLDRDVYIKYIESLLSDKARSEKIDTNKALLSFTANHEKRIKECLISVEQHETVGPRPGILLYKNILDSCPHFRSSLSSIGMRSYKTAKSSILRMNSITSNESTVKDMLLAHAFSTCF